MKDFLKFFGSIGSESDPILDLAVDFGDQLLSGNGQASHIKDSRFRIGDAMIEFSWFDDNAFEKLEITYGYGPNNTMHVLLSNYGDHTVKVCCKVAGAVYPMWRTVPTETFKFTGYRKSLDNQALQIINLVQSLNKSDSWV